MEKARLMDDSRPAINGQDEVAAMETGDPLHNKLKKLMACKNSSSVISCRSARWRRATARLDTASGYSRATKVVNLEALAKEEAIGIFSREAGREKAWGRSGIGLFTVDISRK